VVGSPLAKKSWLFNADESPRSVAARVAASRTEGNQA